MSQGESTTYRIEILPTAVRQMRKLPTNKAKRIDAAILELTLNPRPQGAKKLRGQSDRYRIRIGDYRVIYRIEEIIKIVNVRRIGHRKDIYE